MSWGDSSCCTASAGWLAGQQPGKGSGQANGWLSRKRVASFLLATARVVFTSKSSSVLWIPGQMSVLDEVCFSPEFKTLRQTVDKSFPLKFLQEPRRDRRGATRAFICGGGISRMRCFSINPGVWKTLLRS